MSRIHRSARLALLLVLSVAEWASAAPRVAVVRPSHEADPEGLEPRLRAELEAAGFEVLIVRVDQPASRDELEATARRTDSFAAIALVRPAGAEAVDVWVTDRVTGKTVLRRIDAPAEAAETGSILAVRAVELLRASLIELHLRTTPSGELEPMPEVERFAKLPEPPAKKTPPTPSARAIPPLGPAAAPAPLPAPRAEAPRYAFGLAIEGLASPGGLAPAFAPGAMFFLQPDSHWALGVSLAGPASKSISAAEGSATVDQELALVRGRVFPWPAARVAPLVSLGVGAFRLGAQGAAAGVYRGSDVTTWSAAAALGAGVRAPLADGIRLVALVDSVWLFPEPVVRFASREVATLGRPLVDAALGAEVAW